MPAPPPPPPPVSLKTEEIKQTEIPKINSNDLETAIERIQKFDTDLGKVFYKNNAYLVPQLQEGPKCGLVALSIATSHLNKFVEVDKLLKAARSQNFTKQGEIFDANFLASLASSCGFKCKVIEGGLLQHMFCILNHLLCNNLILLPYDADKNHSPCCKKGFKSHWAVITGFVVFEIKCNIEKYNDTNIISLPSPSCNCPMHVKKADTNLTMTAKDGKILIEKKTQESFNLLQNIYEGKIYLISMQGKSKHIGLWEFSELSKSNDNLLYFSNEREADDYIVPEGGPAVGLKGKAILLEIPSSD